MPNRKQDDAPSFARLLRGSTQPNEPERRERETPARTIVHHPESLRKEDDRKRKPIILPFARGDAEGGMFTVGYREWSFLLGAIALLFGGMGLVRVFAPKDSSLTANFDVPPGEFNDGSRPPDGSEPTEEVVTSANKARDTTRLVQTPGDLLAKPAVKKPTESPVKDQTKDSFWSGLKEAEKQSGMKTPRLPGMLGALNSALAGLSGGGGGGGSGVKPMSSEEIANRLKSISPTGSRGAPGDRLGYSGAQKIPGMGGGGKRSKQESSGDAFRKSRQAGRDALGTHENQPDKSASDLAKKFGENTGGGGSSQQGPGGGAGTGGDTPRQDRGQDGQVNYKIQRDPVADFMAQERFKEQMRKEAKKWDQVQGKMWEGVGTGVSEIAKKLIGDCPGPKQGVCFGKNGPMMDQKWLVSNGCHAASGFSDILGITKVSLNNKRCTLSFVPTTQAPGTDSSKAPSAPAQSGSANNPTAPQAPAPSGAGAPPAAPVQGPERRCGSIENGRETGMVFGCDEIEVESCAKQMGGCSGIVAPAMARWFGPGGTIPQGLSGGVPRQPRPPAMGASAPPAPAPQGPPAGPDPNTALGP